MPLPALETSIIDEKYKEYTEALNNLSIGIGPSLSIDLRVELTKNFVLSVGSFFERYITELIKEFVTCSSSNNETIISMIEMKAINRQFHTYFSWDKANVNSFLALLGPSKRIEFDTKKEGDIILQEGIKKFLTLGNTRNELAHQNFAEYSLQKTLEEYYTDFQNAKVFLSTITNLLTVIPSTE